MDTLKKLYGGDEKLKKFKSQSLRKQYENMQMNDGVAVVHFFLRLVMLSNQMKSRGEKITDFQKHEELQSSLEACEMRLKYKKNLKVTEQALKKFFRKMKEDELKICKVK